MFKILRPTQHKNRSYQRRSSHPIVQFVTEETEPKTTEADINLKHTITHQSSEH